MLSDLFVAMLFIILWLGLYAFQLTYIRYMAILVRLQNSIYFHKHPSIWWVIFGFILLPIAVLSKFVVKYDGLSMFLFGFICGIIIWFN